RSPRTEHEEGSVMARTTGTGLIGGGILAVIVGAIMRYAVTVRPTGFDVHTAGVIILIAGIVAIVAGLIVFVAGGRSTPTMRGRDGRIPGGGEHVQQRDEWVARRGRGGACRGAGERKLPPRRGGARPRSSVDRAPVS